MCTYHLRPRRSLVAAVATLCAAALSSCASINVNDLVALGNINDGGYDIVMEFANVLNLPDRANVVMDGTTVGVVERIEIGHAGVDVTARIKPSIQVPADIHAVLQQATVLGDIFVALERDPAPTSDDRRVLKSNGRIPLTQTISPPQLEDTIANMANFVSSGSIQRMQDTIIGINRVSPARTEQVRAIAHQVSTDLSDLSTNIETVDKWLNGLTGTVDVMTTNVQSFKDWFSPEGMRAWDITTRTGQYLTIIIPSVGSIYGGGYWLTPLLNSAGIALGAVQKTKWAVEGEYRPWRELFTNMFLPEDKYPAMNIISVQTPDGREISDNVHDVLRMLGAVP